ncbi:helix-turn-helix transcriptional regulator [Falsochrobactrum sp. TDYN1]|uniref:Helix-turn-helix transcriptional regulator n=1 Tax=Falsochrobactrum tianjinense TaxID=2706015 RepID=A0A949PKT9_9HYPH|nr:helix-turn-helix transcriptional regulator [Falsochrobactrum sp. TDYN1]MBV2143032.1 helix-turn-helix transcriptional regulator [Falsochrobactrum sp. TDYN1]
MRSVETSDFAKSNKAIAALIDELDNPHFESSFVAALKKVVSFDLAMISIYDQDSVFAPNYPLPFGISDDVLEKYYASTYRFSPFFQMHKLGLRGGVYQMEKLANSSILQKPTRNMDILEIDHSEEVGYSTIGWPKRLREIGLAIRLSSTQTVQVAMYRVGTAHYRPREVESLNAVSQIMSSLYKRFWTSASERRQQPSSMIAKSLQEMACHTLSPRELEVISLIVEGQSGENIAHTLGVGEETIKTHRKRAYQKLGVKSHVELFVLLINRLKKV